MKENVSGCFFLNTVYIEPRVLLIYVYCYRLQALSSNTERLWIFQVVINNQCLQLTVRKCGKQPRLSA